MAATEIDFSNYFQPRPYQADLFKAFFVENKKRVIRVAHRRAGKDTECWNLMWLAAMMRPGLYLYLLPTIGQARSVIWEGRGKDGTKLIDRVPKKLIAGTPNETRMTIRLINGSMIHVTGGDNYEAVLGSNPLGVVLSEYQNMAPFAWDLFLRAVLAENGGWALFNGTPRGHSHLYDLLETNKNNPEWFTTIKTVDDTTYEDGTPIITPEDIEEERRAGMPEELIQQEFYCSFEAGIKGAYYFEQMGEMKEQGRLKLFPIDREAKVHTGWDIGVRDPSSVWLMQNVKGVWRMIYYIEEQDQGLEYYIHELRDVQKKLGFRNYGRHFAPHDIAVREWGSGKSRLSIARELGIDFTPVNNIGGQQIRIIEGISVVRHNMPKMEIHSEHCRRGVAALQEYHATYSKTKKDYTGPNHNWASHASSAMATLCVGYMDHHDRDGLMYIKKYASYIPCAN